MFRFSTLHNVEITGILYHWKFFSLNQLQWFHLQNHCFHEIFAKKVWQRISAISTLWFSNFLSVTVCSHCGNFRIFVKILKNIAKLHFRRPWLFSVSKHFKQFSGDKFWLHCQIRRRLTTFHNIANHEIILWKSFENALFTLLFKSNLTFVFQAVFNFNDRLHVF